MFGVSVSTKKWLSRASSVRCAAAAGKRPESGGRGLWSPRQESVVLPGALNKQDAITGLTLEAFDGVSEVTTKSGELDQIESSQPSESFARKMYASECEAAVNRQINIEYSISYLYHSMYAFFDRDNVGLPGFAQYFKEESEVSDEFCLFSFPMFFFFFSLTPSILPQEERGHAEKLLEYQNKRGGKVVLGALMSPITEFDHADKGEALYAMELALSLEKLNYEKLVDVSMGRPRSCHTSRELTFPPFSSLFAGPPRGGRAGRPLPDRLHRGRVPRGAGGGNQEGFHLRLSAEAHRQGGGRLAL